MIKFLLSTSSLNIINVTIISVSLLTANVAKGETNETSYNPTLEISTRNSKKRNIGELDYMQPIYASENDLAAVDLKLKVDNDKSKEVNLGLIYRHNINDQVIFGAYGYFDHRRTGNNFAVSGFTPGVELLSKYVDFRANYYLPENKRKKIHHNNKKQVKIEGTSIYAVSGGHNYEYALKGYDVEIGGAILGFSDNLNEKFGTKLFVARYEFKNKYVKKIAGTRFRLEQKLGRIQFDDNALNFTLNAETQFDKVRKRQNFIGVGAKFVFGEKTKPMGLKSRMMDTVIRDVDIVIADERASQQISNFVAQDGRVVKKMYYVGGAGANYQGDGTAGSPLSIEQLAKVDLSDAIVVVTTIDAEKGGRSISSNEFKQLIVLPQVINGKNEISLVSNAREGEATAIVIKQDGLGGLRLDSLDKVNTAFVAQVQGNNLQQVAAVTLTVPSIEQKVIHQTLVQELDQVTQVQQQAIQEVQALAPAANNPAAQPAQAPAQPVVANNPAPVVVPAANNPAVQPAQAPAQPVVANNPAPVAAAAANNPAAQAAQAPAQPVVANNPAPVAAAAANNPAAQAAQAPAQPVVANNPAPVVVAPAANNPAVQPAQAPAQPVVANNPAPVAPVVVPVAVNIIPLQVQQALQAVEQAQAAINPSSASEEQFTAAQRVVNAHEVAAQLANQLAAGNFDSGIDLNTLRPHARRMHQLIARVGDMAPTLNSNDHIQDKDYNLINALFVANTKPTGRATHEAVTQLINAHANLTPDVKNKYVEISLTLSKYDGNPELVSPNLAALGNRAQNVGMTHTAPSDITQVSSLHELKKQYGPVSKSSSLELVREISEAIINDVVDPNALDIYSLAENAKLVAPTNEYLQARREYGRLKPDYTSLSREYEVLRTKVQGESAQEKTARKALRDAKKIELDNKKVELDRERAILDREISGSGQTRINEYLAGYRAIKRMEQAKNNGIDFYREKITARFNAYEMLGYSLKALLDTNEISHNLVVKGKVPTPKKIFKAQKENVIQLLKNLGDAQRGGNRNNNNLEDDTQADNFVCTHGTCTRIVGTAFQNHRAVNIKEFTPASLGDEFRAAVIGKVRALPDADYNDALNFQRAFGVSTDIKVNVTPQNIVDFTANDGGVNVAIPAPFKNILNEVSEELNSRYDFLDPNPRYRLVKKPEALAIFEAFQYLQPDELRRP